MAKKPAIKFDPSWCEQIEEMGRAGLVMSNYASRFNCTIAELVAIAKTKKELQASIDLALDLALSFHEERLVNPTAGSQQQLTLAFLKKQWPSLYANDGKSTGGRGAVQTEAVSSEDMVKALTQLFEDLVKAADPGDYTPEHRDEILDRLSGIARN